MTNRRICSAFLSSQSNIITHHLGKIYPYSQLVLMFDVIVHIFEVVPSDQQGLCIFTEKLLQIEIY